MKSRIARTLGFIIFIAMCQIASSDNVASVSHQATAAQTKVCDTRPTWQRPSEAPRTIGMALMGLGLVAVGAVTRRSTVKRA